MTLSNIGIIFELGFSQHAENEMCFWRGNDCRILFLSDCDEIRVEKKSVGVKRWGGWRTWRKENFVQVLDLLEQLGVK